MKRKFKLIALSALTLILCAAFFAACGEGPTPPVIGGDTVLVSFDLNYPGAVASEAPADKSVTVGETYGELETPSRYGYTFGGWYTTALSVNGVKVDANTVVERTDDHTLYARWTLGQYKIYFNPEGGVFTDMSGLSEDGGGVYKQRGTGQDYGFLPKPEKAGSFFLGWYTEAAGGLDCKVTSYTEIIAQDHTLYARWEDGEVLFWDFSNDDDYSYFEGGVPVKNVNGKNWIEIPGLHDMSKMLIPVSVGDTIKFTVVFEKSGALKRGYNLLFMKNDGNMWDNHIDIVDINSYFLTPNAAYGPNAYDVTLKIWDKGGAWGTDEFYLVFENESSDGAPAWNSYYVRLTDIEIVYYSVPELDENRTSWDFSNDDDYNYFDGGVPAKNIGGKNWIEIPGWKEAAMLIPVSVGDTVKFTVVFENAVEHGDGILFKKAGNDWEDNIKMIGDLNPSFIVPNAAYGSRAYDVTLTIWDKNGAWGTDEFKLIFGNEAWDGSPTWDPSYIRLTDIEIVRYVEPVPKTYLDFSNDEDYDYFLGNGFPAKNIGGKNWIEIPGWKEATMLIPVSVGDTVKFTVVFENAVEHGDGILFMKDGNGWEDNIKMLGNVKDSSYITITPNALYGSRAYDVTLTIYNKAGAWGVGDEFYLIFRNEARGNGSTWDPSYIRLTDIEIVRPNIDKNKTSFDFSDDGDYDYFIGGVISAKNIGGKNWIEILGFESATMLIPVSVGDTVKFTVVFETSKAGNDALIFMKNDGNMWDNNIKINDINPSFVTPNAAYGPNAYDVTFTIWNNGGAWGTNEFYLVFANELYRGGGNWTPAYIRLTDIEIIRA